MKDTNQKSGFTRGKGLLEPYLAHLRSRMAEHLIPENLKQGRILDIGCGSYPYFLSHSSFKEKFAIDQLPPTTKVTDIHWHTLDLNTAPKIPFEDNFFNVISLLAVAEHLNPSSLVCLFTETHRVLKPGGKVIITTPASWTDPLLKLMAKLNLVSAEEIDEHVYTYNLPLLGWYFGKAGFEMEKVKFGYFELRMNMWATAEK
ncbi:MAG: class I SAM-dependent methyltransferase [Chloroflexota bacterium]